MNNIIKCHEDLILYIKSVILKYCPYMEDRLSILGSAKSPELDIKININNNESQIMFMFGNRTFKSSVPEQVTTSYTISFEEIGDIISFILDDHEVIKDINFNGKELDLKFAINWSDKSIKGINCSDIGLELTFECIELKEQYLYLLIQKYYTHLEQVSSFKSMKNEYIDSIKYSYFNSLDKTELITFLNRMSENDLKKLLHNLDNDVFINYFMSNEEQPKVRVLSLTDSKDDNKNI